MIDVFARPTPSQISDTDILFAEKGTVFEYLQIIWNEYSAWFLLVIAVFVLGKLWFNTLHRKQSQVEKIWKFLLFFLSKRQMMLPLVYTLAKQDGLLEKEALKKILDIRRECIECSFRRTPQKRMQIERNVSRILFHYFSKLEKSGKIKHQSKLFHLLKDLEFIDEKLLQLQKIYNREALLWNQKFHFFPKKILRIPSFELFE